MQVSKSNFYWLNAYHPTNIIKVLEDENENAGCYINNLTE